MQLKGEKQVLFTRGVADWFPDLPRYCWGLVNCGKLTLFPALPIWLVTIHLLFIAKESDGDQSQCQYERDVWLTANQRVPGRRSFYHDH